MRIDWKRVCVYLVVILEFVCLYIGYFAMIDQNRPGNATYKVVAGDHTEHLTTFEVMIEPGVDADKVYRALMLCPNAYGYVIIPYDESRLMASPWYAPAPFPKDGEDWLIVIADGEVYPSDVGGWTVQYTGRIVVLDLDRYPDVILASIITHECTHQFESGRLDFYTANIAAYSLWIHDEWIGVYPEMGENGWKSLYNLYILDEYLNS